MIRADGEWFVTRRAECGAAMEIAKLKPADIKKLADLPKFPVTTKDEMARDVVAHRPWGTYTPIDDQTWRKRGWMVFSTSGTTASVKGNTKVVAHGLGSYIAQTTAAGDFPKIILGIAVMSLFVTLFNRLLWRPMYAYAESKLRLD